MYITVECMILEQSWVYFVEYILTCFSDGSCYITQAGLELVILLFQSPVRIIGLCHHAWLQNEFFIFQLYISLAANGSNGHPSWSPNTDTRPSKEHHHESTRAWKKVWGHQRGLASSEDGVLHWKVTSCSGEGSFVHLDVTLLCVLTWQRGVNFYEDTYPICEGGALET